MDQVEHFRQDTLQPPVEPIVVQPSIVTQDADGNSDLDELLLLDELTYESVPLEDGFIVYVKYVEDGWIKPLPYELDDDDFEIDFSDGSQQ